MRDVGRGERMKDDRNTSLGRGILAGVVGGLVGSLVLKGFIVIARSFETKRFSTTFDQGGPAHQVGELVVCKTTGEALSAEGRVLAGEIVHYVFGAVVGGFYGGLGEYADWVRWGSGVLFGAGVFLAADETSMPLLGLVKKPTEETTRAQAEHLAAHLAFGVSTELARQAVRQIL